MQLRKCANHPYLFEGAEDRTLPAYGDHIAENSGIMYIEFSMLIYRGQYANL